MEMDDDEKTAKFIEKQIERELSRKGEQVDYHHVVQLKKQ
jgi:ribosome biogenesis protein Nip4